ncbi:hypothetical protein H0H93_009949 [Arthromyces matolae]|nr:hypothetical protein H0H93_009949 [Arthromyces matolae]
MKFLSKTCTTGTPGRLPEAETSVTVDKSISTETNQKPHDPRRLAEHFIDLVYLARSQKEREEDRKADEWLKKARVLILQKLEKSYNGASDSINENSTSQSSAVPKWALNPSNRLSVEIPWISDNLHKTYEEMFEREIRKLLNDCGFVEGQNYQFNKSTYCVPAKSNAYQILFFFPHKLPSKLPVCDRLDIFQVNGLAQFKEGIHNDPGRGSSSSLTLIPHPE